jgi:hypothetical protein
VSWLNALKYGQQLTLTARSAYRLQPKKSKPEWCGPSTRRTATRDRGEQSYNERQHVTGSGVAAEGQPHRGDEFSVRLRCVIKEVDNWCVSRQSK